MTARSVFRRGEVRLRACDFDKAPEAGEVRLRACDFDKAPEAGSNKNTPPPKHRARSHGHTLYHLISTRIRKKESRFRPLALPNDFPSLLARNAGLRGPLPKNSRTRLGREMRCPHSETRFQPRRFSLFPILLHAKTRQGRALPTPSQSLLRIFHRHYNSTNVGCQYTHGKKLDEKIFTF